MEPLLAADQPDEGKILAQIDRVAQARAELEKANARMLLGLRRVLTSGPVEDSSGGRAARPLSPLRARATRRRRIESRSPVLATLIICFTGCGRIQSPNQTGFSVRDESASRLRIASDPDYSGSCKSPGSG